MKELPALSAAARARLAPEFLALFEGGAASPLLDLVDGRVRVRVVTAQELTPERIAALEAAGLQIHLRGGASAVGRISIEGLGGLAELGFVLRVEPE